MAHSVENWGQLLVFCTFKCFQSVVSSTAGLDLELKIMFRSYTADCLQLHKSHKFKICIVQQLYRIKELRRDLNKAYIDDGYEEEEEEEINLCFVVMI